MQPNWRMSMVVAAAFAAGLAMMPRAVHGAAESVFFPIKRIVCDRKARACYDNLGASVPLTRAHLGDAAADVLERRIRRAGKSWDATHFTLTNGVDCWTEKKACYVRAGSDEIDRETSQALFGSR